VSHTSDNVDRVVRNNGAQVDDGVCDNDGNAVVGDGSDQPPVLSNEGRADEADEFEGDKLGVTKSVNDTEGLAVDGVRDDEGDSVVSDGRDQSAEGR